ncbi:3-oxoacid CoA-transferase subunit B [Pseudomonas sp. TH10]|uniref:3-oxoacid CoA-transferase subunit B n=1 Tax=Pseudomonas sp. TH10 TaxID=2796376 RepID=UPI0019134390|nr:3-oxoacid CoA-transferase subunit B [Pseudomonas sp. TH10]MBK5517419.1 3-oxoacid CoA-transferase subunit B [Pseudomonas sp. TH10]
MTGMDKNARIAMAQRVARDITEGSYVNLGIGLPTLVANHLPLDKDFFLHSENGVLGRWQAAAPGEEDWDMINAGKEPIELAPGGAFFHHADSFGMMRGGHLDVCVLGAFQVSATGDLANWHTGAADAIPAVGGAMDLAIGAKRVFVMMEHLAKDGCSKLLPACTYPLTGLGCVSRVYTELATMDITASGVKVLELIGDITPQALQEVTQVPLDFSALTLRDDSSTLHTSLTRSALATMSQ